MNVKRSFAIGVILSLLGFGLSLNVVRGQEAAAPAEPGSVDRLLNVLKRFTRPGSEKPSTEGTIIPTNQNIPLYRPVLDYERAVTDVVERSSRAVVSIVISKDVPVVEQRLIDPFEGIELPSEFRNLFDFKVPQLEQRGTERKKIGGGTGFIVSTDGVIVTNKHVVGDKSAEYTIFLNDGRKFSGRVLALHPVDDLAVLKIEATNLSALRLGNSDNLKLGQTAIAIGNSLGEFQNTVSVGVVSGLKRSIVASDANGSIERLEDLIQTDAAINFGNSGGPVLNLRGEVIGVSTAVVSGAQNIGFAIPINRARRTVDEVATKGRVEVPFLGVRYVLITEEVKKKFDLKLDSGAFIYADQADDPIVPGSPAAKSGLQKGDIITAVDGETITQQISLAQLISKKRVGQSVQLTIWRKGQSLTLKLVLAELPTTPKR